MNCLKMLILSRLLILGIEVENLTVTQVLQELKIIIYLGLTKMLILISIFILDMVFHLMYVEPS